MAVQERVMDGCVDMPYAPLYATIVDDSVDLDSTNENDSDSHCDMITEQLAARYAALRNPDEHLRLQRALILFVDTHNLHVLKA